MLLFRTIHDVALMIDRERSGRAASPMGGRDRQPVGEGSWSPKSAATSGQEDRWPQAPHRRSIPMDGSSWFNLTTADISDSAGAQMILHAIRQRGPSSSICSQTAPTTGASSWTKAAFEGFVIEVVRRIQDQPASMCCPRRWWSNAPSPG